MSLDKVSSVAELPLLTSLLNAPLEATLGTTLGKLNLKRLGQFPAQKIQPTWLKRADCKPYQEDTASATTKLPDVVRSESRSF
ncbi:MAG: hypothetical protein JO235_08130 [Chroococcidiopsidaceae cyanobacterium CP_BM_RX_35]|nr:hypothetical protein [Chroococcidiopsidaceae cyanobacterium CP_BM_RX_35]